MPGTDTLGSWRDLHEVDPHVRVLLSSGYDRARALRELPPAVDFLPKPHSRSVLLRKVQDMLASGREPERPSTPDTATPDGATPGT